MEDVTLKGIMRVLGLALSLLVAGGMAALGQGTGGPLVTKAAPQKWAIVMHGGAGVIERATMKPETEVAYRAGMDTAIRAAAKVLDGGGHAMDAIEAALKMLEEDPLFNCGHGAVFAADGTNQLDAAMMDGATMKAGAVADVTRTRHPIALARAVMEKSPHVMLIGSGADDFAKSVGLEQVPNSFFFTERRWQGLVEQLKKEGKPIPPRPAGAPPVPTKPVAKIETPDAHKYGTTGMVVRDREGNIAAGTTTGGVSGKLWNRVGDTPIIGAGTYASNQSCAVSATGTGEYFIRLTVARTICALVEYKGMALQAAVDDVVQRQLGAIHGDGGLTARWRGGSIRRGCFGRGWWRVERCRWGSTGMSRRLGM